MHPTITLAECMRDNAYPANHGTFYVAQHYMSQVRTPQARRYLDKAIVAASNGRYKAASVYIRCASNHA